MFQRRISEADVGEVLATGETIEAYPADTPYPSRLVLGWRGTRPLHIVVADNAEADEAIVITASEPDPNAWGPGFRRRRER